LPRAPAHLSQTFFPTFTSFNRPPFPLHDNTFPQRINIAIIHREQTHIQTIMSTPQSTAGDGPATTAEARKFEQITFRFCSECSNMLYPKEDPDAHQLQFTCRTCQYTELAQSSCVFRNVLENSSGETAGVTQDVGSDPTVSTAAFAAPSCSGAGAGAFVSCLVCGHADHCTSHRPVLEEEKVLVADEMDADDLDDAMLLDGNDKYLDADAAEERDMARALAYLSGEMFLGTGFVDALEDDFLDDAFSDFSDFTESNGTDFFMTPPASPLW
jgi:DNA-directed RNA polymerase II subunit RPB9